MYARMATQVATLKVGEASPAVEDAEERLILAYEEMATPKAATWVGKAPRDFGSRGATYRSVQDTEESSSHRESRCGDPRSGETGAGCH
jgi:hypothetical protein